ncbi:Rieske (2Fe-2S) protein [Candidatus Poribacteria bacterium]|jgi:nitrite reductase (NADH) small subunit|nr:Rieske (2Fe-2S) protein [Candidatus Poribacteria bacterium]MBT5711004.1 Rieske (2Fe-2S) protein [Candidatus Poribacteria bacterium]MBT7097407.1 Rieske (2Fe-2S) protein [Candidatus Poribacteria bacterium]MBT7803951.1 Rieske (2Fe-2S) protein [Candidatus Poribacteria bacterium]
MQRMKACSLDELPEGQCRVVQLGKRYITVARRGDNIHAVDDTCPHMGGSLGTGWLTAEGTVVCPWHGWEFRLEDGAGVWPSGIKLDTFETSVEDGVVYVHADDAAETAAD